MNVEELKQFIVQQFYKNNYDHGFDPYIERLAEDICNLNILCVNPLNEEDTNILRDFLGVNKRNVKVSQYKISAQLHVSRNAISQRIKKIYFILKKRIAMDYCGRLYDDNEKAHLLAKDIFCLNLSFRAYNILKSNGINTVEDLVRCSFDNLKGIDNLGPKLLGEIYDKVHYTGLEFGLKNLPKVKDNSYNDLIYKESIENLGLSNRAYNCLKRNYIDNVGDLVRNTYQYITQIKGLGPKASLEIAEVVHKLGLNFLDEENTFEANFDESVLLQKYKLLLLRKKALSGQLDDINDEIENLKNYFDKSLVKKK